MNISTSRTIFLILLSLFLLSAEKTFANDFYPANIQPNGAVFQVGSSIPISFDICLGYDYQAYSHEWYAEVTIKNSFFQDVYTHTVNGFDANGPACFSRTAPDFVPSETGAYFLYVYITYLYDINVENDFASAEFNVTPPQTDLAITEVLLPNMGDIYYENSSELFFSLRLLNDGDTDIGADQWRIKVYHLQGDIITPPDVNIAPADFVFQGDMEITAHTAVDWTSPTAWPVDDNAGWGLYFYAENIGFEDSNPDNNKRVQEYVVFGPPDPVSEIFPQNDGFLPANPPPTFRWDNGETPIISQTFELLDNGTPIISQELPPDAESFSPVIILESNKKYGWTLEQTNPSGPNVNGPFPFTTIPEDPFNLQFEVNKVDFVFNSPSNPVGLFTVIYTPGDEGVFLTVHGENGQDELGGVLISNLFLPPNTLAETPTELSATFDFTLISLPPYDIPFNVDLSAYITDQPVLDLPETPVKVTTAEVTEIEYDPKGAEVPEEQIINPAPVTIIEHTEGDEQTTVVYRPDPGNLDLDGSQHPATAMFAGDINACVPTATANSMKWMERVYPAVDLPDDMDLRKTMETLSGLMQRATGEGTYTDKMIIGKLDFMEQFNLPVEVKFQTPLVEDNLSSTSGNSTARNFNEGEGFPTWDFLKGMIEDGEDVEMNFTWYDSGAGKWYAHSVNLTAVMEYSSGKKVLTFKHDTYQSGSGGLKQEVHEVSIDADGIMRFGQHNENYIRDVVAESPIASLGEKAAGWVNEFLSLTGLLKSNSDASSIEEFIEIVINQNVDLSKYRVSLYNENGGQVTSVGADQFTIGTTADSFTVYTYTFPGNTLPDNHGGIGMSYSGTPIEGTFISWGGAITAVNGDWTGLTSTDIGITPQAGSSIALTGTGTSSGDFTWNLSEPSPGNVNPSQTIPVELASFTASVDKEGVRLKWITASEINNKGFEIERTESETSSKWVKLGFVNGSGTTTGINQYSFVDGSITSGRYSYRLKQIDYDGTFEYSNTVEVDVNVPVNYALEQNYPNPFNPVTNIVYSLPENGTVKLAVYNLLGEAIINLVNEFKEAGTYKAEFNGENLNSGVYFYRLEINGNVFTKKLLLLK